MDLAGCSGLMAIFKLAEEGAEIFCFKEPSSRTKEELRSIFSKAAETKTISEGICFFRSVERLAKGVGVKGEIGLMACPEFIEWVFTGDFSPMISQRLGMLKLASGAREAISEIREMPRFLKVSEREENLLVKKETSLA